MRTIADLKSRRERRRQAFTSRPCEWCDRVYTPIRLAQKFCSPDCRKTYHREAYIARKEDAE